MENLSNSQNEHMNDNHDLDAYIERIKAIKWFQPSEKIDKAIIEKQTSVILKAF